jgi:hypothetical protein
LHLLRARPEQTDWCHENPPPAPGYYPAICLLRFCFPPEVIVLAVRWYLRFKLSYRDVEELLTERGVQVDHVPSTAGCCGLRRCWPRPPGPADTLSATAGR